MATIARSPPAAPAWAPGRPGVGFIGCDLPPSVSVRAKMFEQTGHKGADVNQHKTVHHIFLRGFENIGEIEVIQTRHCPPALTEAYIEENFP